MTRESLAQYFVDIEHFLTAPFAFLQLCMCGWIKLSEPHVPEALLLTWLTCSPAQWKVKNQYARLLQARFSPL